MCLMSRDIYREIELNDVYIYIFFSNYDFDNSVHLKRGIIVLANRKTEYGMHLHKGQAQDSLGL